MCTHNEMLMRFFSKDFSDRWQNEFSQGIERMLAMCERRPLKLLRLLIILTLALVAYELRYELFLDTSILSTPSTLKKSPTLLKIPPIIDNDSKEAVRNDELCKEIPPGLGPISVIKTKIRLEWVLKRFPEVDFGGFYYPPYCTARQKVAIIVPYRDRQRHLAIFLNHLHPFLMMQQIEYGIFIIEQKGIDEFNRAKLMNVGFVESQKLKPGGWQCFIFHDVDLLPMDSRNMYKCLTQPKHLSVAIDTRNFDLKLSSVFGGVSAMTLEQFTKVDGFSNKYWGWGCEDDDMFYRIRRANYDIIKSNGTVGRYIMLKHKKAIPNEYRHELLSRALLNNQNDGLSTLKYKIVRFEKRHLCTHLVVDIG